MQSNKGLSYVSPVVLNNQPIYATEQQALEIEEIGVYEVAGQAVMDAYLRDADQYRTDESEAKRFATTGVRLGTYPNY